VSHRRFLNYRRVLLLPDRCRECVHELWVEGRVSTQLHIDGEKNPWVRLCVEQRHEGLLQNRERHEFLPHIGLRELLIGVNSGDQVVLDYGVLESHCAMKLLSLLDVCQKLPDRNLASRPVGVQGA
jgi:hypothetical protein